MVHQKHSTAIIVHWIVVNGRQEIIDKDPAFDQTFDTLGIMERYPESAMSYEKLDEIADALIEGKEIIFVDNYKSDLAIALHHCFAACI